MSDQRVTRRNLLLGGASLAALGAVAGCAAPYSTPEAESAYPPIGKFIEVDGLRVHAWEAGSGRPVILIHGASGNLRDWTFSIAPKLAEKYRVIAFDRPGLGYTERPAEGGWDPAVQARLLHGAAQQMNVENPVIVGHSWGGALAMSWALQFGNQTAGVVPVSGVTMPYGGLSRVFSAIGLSSVIASAYTEYMKSVADSGGIESFVARVFRPQSPPEGYLDYVGAPLALREKTLDANSEDIERLNEALRRMAPDYAGLSLPVEIIHGSADFIDPERHALGLNEAVPGARLNLLPGVGHMAHQIAPEALAAAIERIDRAAA